MEGNGKPPFYKKCIIHVKDMKIELNLLRCKILPGILKLESFFVRGVFETNYSRMDQVKFFKSCLPQILLGPFLNTLSHLKPCETSAMESF